MTNSRSKYGLERKKESLLELNWATVFPVSLPSFHVFISISHFHSWSYLHTNKLKHNSDLYASILTLKSLLQKKRKWSDFAYFIGLFMFALITLYGCYPTLKCIHGFTLQGLRPSSKSHKVCSRALLVAASLVQSDPRLDEKENWRIVAY